MDNNLVDSLRPINIFFSRVGTGLTERTQCNDPVGGETRTNNPSIPSLKLYQLSLCAPKTWIRNTKQGAKVFCNCSDWSLLIRQEEIHIGNGGGGVGWWC